MKELRKYMCVDYGEKRVGIAVSDLTGTLAVGSAMLQVRGMRDAAVQAAEFAGERGVACIVVGMPVNMNGTYGGSAEKVRAFADMLRELSDAEVVFFDERCSTKYAHQMLNISDVSAKKRAGAVDMLSAQIVLQNFLDARKSEVTD